MADDNGFMDALKREAKINEVAEEAIRVIEAQQDEIERLRAIVDTMTDRPFRGTSAQRRERMYGSDWAAVHDALDAYEEARRG